MRKHMADKLLPLSPAPDLEKSDYQALGAFRYQIRRFLHFSDDAARAEGLEPQQHQLLLAIKALPDPQGPTVGMLADYLLLRHHSAVGLIDRLAERGLVVRIRGAHDLRQVRVRLAPPGEEKLARLSSVHREELRTSGPLLVDALTALLRGRS
jgi:DNA-binding MarR family transcriptional regulator